MLIFHMFCRNSELNTNNVDADWTPHSVASDMDILYLPMSLFIGR